MKIVKSTNMEMVIKQKLLEFTDNLVMGILNVTPDSFYDESRIQSEHELLKRAEKMLTEGADILDIGGYSSRPGAIDITVNEELNRTTPAISALKKEFPKALISLDTFRSEVAISGLDSGADIINDISAGTLDEKLPEIVAKHKVPYIIMHMRGTPQTMQRFVDYENLIQEIFRFFDEKSKAFHALGIHDIILDPGFGFAKTVDQNFEIIKHFEIFKQLDHPLLVGISRKSFIQKQLNVNIDEALTGTTVLHTLLLQKGAQIIRTHDVLQAKQTIELLKTLS